MLAAVVGLLAPMIGWALGGQEEEMPPGASATFGFFFVVFFIFMLAIYVYMALSLQTIAKKTNTENA
jgi:cytochrome c biogenesis factor